MEITGTVFKITKPQSGISKEGKPWSKVDVVFKTTDNPFPKYTAITFIGKSYDDAMKLKVGQTCTVSVNIDSREYNEKWYTNVSAWRVVISEADASDYQHEQQVVTKLEQSVNVMPQVDDLPF